MNIPNKHVSRRKTFTPYLSAALLLMISTGCTVENPVVSHVMEKPSEITVAHSWGKEFEDSFNKTLLPRFEADHPNIKVSFEEIPSIGWELPSDDWIQLFKGGDAPDLVLLDRSVYSKYASQDALTDLSGYIKASRITASDYYKAAWDECLFHGNSYCLPLNINTRQMLYNKTMMAAAGLNPEHPPATIDELEQMSDRMVKKGANGQYEQIGSIPWADSDGGGGFFTYGLMFGGQWEHNDSFTPNDPKIVNALEWVVNQYNKYDQIPINNFTDSKERIFKRGNIAFVFADAWTIGNFIRPPEPAFEWGIAPLPSIDGHGAPSLAGGDAAVIPKGAGNPDAAWELLKFFAHNEGAKLWAEQMKQDGVSMLSAMPSVNDELKLADNPYLAPYLAAIPKAVPFPHRSTSMDLWKELGSSIHQAIIKEKSPKQVLNEWKSKSDAAISKVNSTRPGSKQ